MIVYLGTIHYSTPPPISALAQYKKKRAQNRLKINVIRSNILPFLAQQGKNFAAFKSSSHWERIRQFNFTFSFNKLPNFSNLVLSNGSKNLQNMIKKGIKIAIFLKKLQK